MVHTNSNLTDIVFKIPVHHTFSVRAVLTHRGKDSSIVWGRWEAQKPLDIKWFVASRAHPTLQNLIP